MLNKNHIKEKICASLEGKDVEIIDVKGKSYIITLKTMKMLKGLPKAITFPGRTTDEWVCAYVDLENVNKEKYELANESYRVGKTHGVDTAHAMNEIMTLEEKREDAIRQIKELIESAIK